MFHTRIRQAGAAQAARAAPGLVGDIEWSPEASPGPPRRKRSPARAGGRRRVSYSQRGVLERTRGCSACARSGAAWLQDGDRERRRRAAHWRPWHLDVRVRTFPSHPPHGAARRVTGVAFSGEERGEYRIHTSDSSPQHGSIALRLAQSFANVGWPRLARTHAHVRMHAHTGAHARARASTRANSCAHTHRAVRRLAPATFEDQIPL